MQEKQLNPFQPSAAPAALMDTETQRAVAEVQGAILIAQRFPRDEALALERIRQACSRPALAEAALYAYPRGNTTVEGPSIRLAEAVAQAWGNLQFGIRELSQEKGVSTVEAFAWDVQTNTRSTKVFQFKHERLAKGQVKALTDPRDIYEMTANQGARRLRGCLLSVIPGDIIEAAQQQAAVTLAQSSTVDAKSVAALAGAFAEYGVTEAQLQARLGGKHLAAMTNQELANLRKVYRSLRDGMGKPADFFDGATESSGEAEALAERLGEGGTQGQPPGPVPSDHPKAAPPKTAHKPPEQQPHKAEPPPAAAEPTAPAEAGKVPVAIILEAIQGSRTMDELKECAEQIKAYDGRTGEAKRLNMAMVERRAQLYQEKADAEAAAAKAQGDAFGWEGDPHA